MKSMMTLITIPAFIRELGFSSLIAAGCKKVVFPILCKDKYFIENHIFIENKHTCGGHYVYPRGFLNSHSDEILDALNIVGVVPIKPNTVKGKTKQQGERQYE